MYSFPFSSLKQCPKGLSWEWIKEEVSFAEIPQFSLIKWSSSLKPGMKLSEKKGLGRVTERNSIRAQQYCKPLTRFHFFFFGFQSNLEADFHYTIISLGAKQTHQTKPSSQAPPEALRGPLGPATGPAPSAAHRGSPCGTRPSQPRRGAQARPAGRPKIRLSPFCLKLETHALCFPDFLIYFPPRPPVRWRKMETAVEPGGAGAVGGEGGGGAGAGTGTVVPGLGLQLLPGPEGRLPWASG